MDLIDYLYLEAHRRCSARDKDAIACPFSVRGCKRLVQYFFAQAPASSSLLLALLFFLFFTFILPPATMRLCVLATAFIGVSSAAQAIHVNKALKARQAVEFWGG